MERAVPFSASARSMARGFGGRSDGDERAICLPSFSLPSASHFDGFEEAFPVLVQYASSAGITDNERTFVRQLCRVHEAA